MDGRCGWQSKSHANDAKRPRGGIFAARCARRRQRERQGIAALRTRAAASRPVEPPERRIPPLSFVIAGAGISFASMRTFIDRALPHRRRSQSRENAP